MEENELAEETERGVEDLNFQHPHHDSIYEIRIPRKIINEDGTESNVQSVDDYLMFLKKNVFPMIDELIKDAQIAYWHILNHGEYLDLRIAIQNDDQMKASEEVVRRHFGNTLNLNSWPKYQNKSLGSRLGCQALMRLFHAQSKFTKEIIESIFWIKDNIPEADAEYLTKRLIYSVPVLSI
jgi:hypothetical protein